MSDHMIQSLTTVVAAIIGLAILAVLVSRNAQTGQVITSAGAALANDISAAVAPVSGATATVFTGGYGGFTGMGAPLFQNQY